MTNKYTPGPWRASCRDIAYKGGEWSEEEFLQWEVDGPRIPFGRGEFFQRDAMLIAAAPELLEALMALKRAGGIWPDLLPKVDCAIAKATGEVE